MQKLYTGTRTGDKERNVRPCRWFISLVFYRANKRVSVSGLQNKKEELFS